MINNNNNQQYEKPTIALNRFRWVFLIIALVFMFYVFTLLTYKLSRVPVSRQGRRKPRSCNQHPPHPAGV